ncbi:MAG6790 family protein [Mycoplasmopsis agassizii]|uniref:Uncharacterized protein n=1 Tax=Mycoplasmopsis agassizii TaxID=33922 RepID=A0A1W1WY23_9BACT|nr:hypothetical protein [Mycoplasmopsis agassizii]PAF54693.1 hypothetical protein CJF60_03060 [Mycoplasmopsis agassizii]PAK21110.1 hypothetical protein CJJ23_03870 [Mycoplasmopsis agassizii]SMC16011.1 hypothetical protein SAMN02745179_00190 [Mycoplasmopsis agassizii]
MYQYKAILKSTKEVVAEGHSVKDVENDIKAYRRAQKKGEHTKGQELIEIYHVFREKTEGEDNSKKELIKTV